MSCGPVNSLQKLSTHSQVDRSLHQDHQQRQGTSSQQFRQVQQNHQLEREFQNQFNPIFQNAFQTPQHIQPRPTFQQQPLSPAPQQETHSGGWASDFAKLSLKQRHQQPQHLHHQAPPSNWSAQFMNHIPQQQQVPHISNTTMSHVPQMRYNNAKAMMYQPHTQQSHLTEHKELHRNEISFSELESEFAQIEKELEPVMQKEPVIKQKDPGFRNAAKEISNIMNTSKNSKFANSEFLKLMHLVSSGQVELNNDETKLVDENGIDIHEAKLNESSAFENTQRAPEEEELKDTNNHGHLPDPLEGLTAQDLSSPFESAVRVGEIHGDRYSWEDVYEDYKNDDTNF